MPQRPLAQPLSILLLLGAAVAEKPPLVVDRILAAVELADTEQHLYSQYQLKIMSYKLELLGLAQMTQTLRTAQTAAIPFLRQLQALAVVAEVLTAQVLLAVLVVEVVTLAGTTLRNLEALEHQAKVIMVETEILSLEAAVAVELVALEEITAELVALVLTRQ